MFLSFLRLYLFICAYAGPVNIKEIREVMSKPTTKRCVGQEHFTRMNYLLQISRVALNVNQPIAAHFYSTMMVNIAKKTVLKIDPVIKREMCKRCHQNLIPGVNSKVRIRKKKIVTTCNFCEFQRRIKTGKDYQIWSDKAEAVEEILDYHDDTK